MTLKREQHLSHSDSDPDYECIRIIARLDVKGQHLIKGVQMEGLRKVGSPGDFAASYYQQGADELLFMDAVASLYQRDNLLNIVQSIAQQVFVPITVGGGVRSCEDFELLLRSGADKVAVNTAALASPGLITELANRFGSQSVVLSVEAQTTDSHTWEAMTNNGRQRSGKCALNWIAEGTQRGAGEVLITSVNQEGTRRGFDTALMTEAARKVTTPVIASGGFGQVDHLRLLLQEADVSGIAFADALHFKRFSLQDIKDEIRQFGFKVRDDHHV